MTGARNNQIVRTINLGKCYRMGQGELHALRSVNLSLERGEFAGLVGPSGSGKTSLLNIIGTLDVPSSGSAEVLGVRVESLTPSQAAALRRRSIGFVFQTFNLLPVYSAYENIEFPLLLLKVPSAERRARVMEALDWVGLKDRAFSRPTELSGGECQRIAIARAIVKRPEIVIADEPTANLDAENSHHILKTMLDLNRNLGTTFLFSTHDEKVIRYLRRRISLADGQIVADQVQDDKG
ncbi:MAG: ABC transporter ATP-binding protein [candidate division WOR-3 bacterium]